jgi:GNAT superfamily N-acetyltransferase
MRSEPAVAAHRPAARLWIAGRRREGTLEEEAGGSWIFHGAGSADLGSVQRLELELCADAELSRRLGVPRFQIRSFEPDAAAGRVRWRPIPFQEEQARLFKTQERFPVTLTGASLLGRALAGEVEALAPYEALLAVEDREHLLFPGAVVALEAARPWGAKFSLTSRIDFLERRGESTRLYVRLLDRRSVQEASFLAVCECPGFSTHTMWTYGLPSAGLDRLVRIRQAANAVDLVQVCDLRRAAHQFHGLRPADNDWQLWSDPLDETAVLLLVSLGVKPVATARLAVQDEGRVELSQMAIHPAFRGVGLRVPLFEEAVRLARSLGGRYLIGEPIPKLEPILREMGAVPLDLGRPVWSLDLEEKKKRGDWRM